MREIKFRGWCDSKKEMFAIEVIDWERDILRDSGDWYDIDSTIKMQFTGLKDKDGTEIYEGDIVALDGALPKHAKEDGKRHTFHVAWYKAQWSVKSIVYSCRHNLFTYYRIDPWKNKIQVIGNVYENPELMK